MSRYRGGGDDSRGGSRDDNDAAGSDERDRDEHVLRHDVRPDGSSLDSLDDLSESNEESDGSSSGRTNDDSLAEAAGGTETLPCGVSAASGQREVSTRVRQTAPPLEHAAGQAGGAGGGGGFHWTLSNWGATQAARRRAQAGGATVRVDLASPEDISLDTDSTRAGFNAYGTTV